MSLYEQSHSTLGEMAQSSNDKHYELPSIVSDRSDDFDANQLDDSKTMQDFEASPPQSVPQLLLIPSLRGHMSTEGLSVVC